MTATDSRRVVLLGPPGTGKTTALMGIVADLLADGYRSHEIAFVSYSRAAVKEARDRVVAKTGIPAEEWPLMRTLHSMWSRLLGLSKDRFLTPADMRTFAARSAVGIDLGGRDEASEDAYLDAEADPTPDAQLRSALDWCRATMTHPRNGASRLRDPRRDAERYRVFVAEYEAFRYSTAKLDHTDILEQALEERIVIPCRALIVDEAQDLSPLQQATLRQTIAQVERVWVAGDDDQAIYDFQGASPAWLIGLTRDPAWLTRVLDRSWRCPEEVRAPAQAIAERLTERADKDYRSRDGSGRYLTGVTHDAAMAMIETGARSSFALARTKRGCARFAALLWDAGAPYISERGGRSPLDPRGLRGIVDALHAIYTGTPIAASALTAALTSPLCPGERGKVRIGIVGHGGKARIEEWGKRHGDALVTLDRAEADNMGLDRAYTMDPWDLLETVRAWPVAAGDARSALQWLRALWDRHGRAWPEHCCIVTTWHGSKGREADLVVIDPALPFPAARALSRGGAEADTEHRCAYVALTRARREAVVLREDFEARGNYPFPSPSAIAPRYPEPAAAWSTYAARSDIAVSTVDALLADVAEPHGLTGMPAYAVAWAWHGWRDLFDASPLLGRDAAAARRAVPHLPHVVASRLMEVAQ